jgi:hypothetical protein
MVELRFSTLTRRENAAGSLHGRGPQQRVFTAFIHHAPHTLVSAPLYPAGRSSTDLSDDYALSPLAEFSSEIA